MTRSRRKTKSYPSQSQNTGFDYPLFLAVVLLTFFGVLMVYDASVVEAFRDFSDKYYFARLQLIWAAIGLTALLLASRMSLKLIKQLAFPAFVISLILLVAVLIPGVGQQVQGARRWLKFGAVSLQPSELLKLSFVLYLSVWLENSQKFWHFITITGLVLFLVMLQPDLGTSVVVMTTGVAMYFLSGAPIVYLLSTIAAGAIGGLSLILASPYRRERLLTFLNPTRDPLGSSYHIRQVLIALGSGGLLGVGIGRSRQKYEYLPEATTDSIFAVISEEVGFIGSLIIILALLFIIIRGLAIARRAKSHFSQLLAGGISAWIGTQVLLNLAAMVALVPLTGIPLPFISYGGSSLVSVLTATGILLNISRQT